MLILYCFFLPHFEAWAQWRPWTDCDAML